MKFVISHPSKATVEASPDEIDRLKKQLTFTNTAIQHDIKRHSNNFWARSKNREQWESVLHDLTKRSKRTLVFEENQSTYIYPGSIPYLSSLNPTIKNDLKYLEPKKVAWAHPLPFELYPYQEESWKKLLEVKHGNVELCTGSGKSVILLKICRETGFRTAIVVPSRPIFNELLKKFEYHFGRGMVGALGDGKKRLGKRFTICIGDSLANIKEGSSEWDFFANLDMLCVDESHTWGATTLESICFGVLADIPYRFFLSGTQTRGDGTEKLLQGIIGETVHSLSTREAVEKGYICPHDYKIIEIESSNPNYVTQDALDMKRVHLLKNTNICAFIAKLVNAEALTYKRQTLVLVEELEQITMLARLLKVPFAVAHSEKRKERLESLGLEKVDPGESIEKFNKAEVMVLIGTSCISTGVNIFPGHNTVNWQGGTSEIKTKQGAVGRSIRLYTHNPWANRCVPKYKATIWDFRVRDVDVMVRHLEERLAYYRESGSEIKTIRLTK
jgi:superfamily II DNA or RNA helicase